MSIAELPLKHWAGQTAAVISFEIRKFRAGRKWIFPFLLAAAPISLISMLMLFGGGRPPNNGDMTEMFAVLFQTLILRLMIFVGCALIFASIYRGDMVTKTMHYYLLSPIRREVLVLGKYLAGLLIAGALYGASVAATNILFHSANGPDVADAHFFAGPGMGQLVRYVSIAVLACAGYGSVFMLAGFLFKNPAIPAAFVLVWESANVFLPEALKKISVIHYLQSITPVPIPFGPFAVITAPTSPVTSVVGLTLFTAAALTLGTLLMRRSEIDYTSE